MKSFEIDVVNIKKTEARGNIHFPVTLWWRSHGVQWERGGIA